MGKQYTHPTLMRLTPPTMGFSQFSAGMTIASSRISSGIFFGKDQSSDAREPAALLLNKCATASCLPLFAIRMSWVNNKKPGSFPAFDGQQRIEASIYQTACQFRMALCLRRHHPMFSLNICPLMQGLLSIKGTSKLLDFYLEGVMR